MDGLSLSPVTLFLEAGPVGKAVMAILLAASLWCWVLIVEGVFTVVRLAARGQGGARRRAGGAVRRDRGGGARGRAARRRRRKRRRRRRRVAETMRRAGRELLMRAEGGLPNLAVISSVAPFVGLFGTVWGIMTSFAGIAAAQGHQPGGGRPRRRRGARRHRLRPRRGDSRLDRL